MTERDWTGDLEHWLRERFAELCAATSQRTPLSGLRISPPLDEEEAKYFLLGLEEGLFKLDEQGGIQTELLGRPGEPRAEENSYRIFSDEPPAPRLLRENVCQLAAASMLILKRGWLRRHVTLEPRSKEHRATARGVDLLVRLAGKIVIWVEVKRSAAELQKLVADLRACSRRGPHAHADCGFPQNHPRYEFCISSKPTYLWAVAPDAEICFKIESEQASIDLRELTSLPPRSLIELK